MHTTCLKPTSCARHQPHVNSRVQRVGVRPWALQQTACQASTSYSQAELEESWKMLKDFSLKQFKKQNHDYTATREARDKMRAAVKAIYQHPWPPAAWSRDNEYGVLLGIMASDSHLAVRALRDWCQELDIEYILPENKVEGAVSLSSVQGSVYVKHNPRLRICYLSPYLGNERGVLLQLGQEQLGHFPLGLWDEEQKNPAPSGV